MSGEREGSGSRRVGEACLVFVPAGGMLAVCEAAGISHIRTRSRFSAARLNGDAQTYRLHPLSVVHTLYMLIYTLRKRIRAGNSVFG